MRIRFLRALRCCGIIVGLLVVAPGRSALAATYPSPVGRVNDFAHVMDEASVQRLEEALEELERRTGAEVAVVTMSSVEGGDIERAAEVLFRQWGIGKRRGDNGVLILCAVQNRRVRIEVGYGLESLLPDAVCGRIIRDRMAKHFTSGDYSAGLVDGTLTVASLIAKHAGVALGGIPQAVGSIPDELPGSRHFSSVLLFCFVVFVLIVLMRKRSARWGGTGWESSIGTLGGWSGGGFGGGSGGFGGGSSGGGGASGSW